MPDYKQLLVFLFWCWTYAPCSAQEVEAPDKDYCQPGVPHKSPGKGLAVEYAYFPGYHQTSSASDNADVKGNHHFLAKFKIPIINTARTKVLFGARYFEEVYQIRNPKEKEDWLFYNLDGKKLKSHRFSLAMSRSFDQTHYFGLKAECAFNGDYDAFVATNRSYRESYLIGMLGRKKDANKEWGVGWVIRTGYRGTASYPFFTYNQTFNHRWGVEATLPVKAMIRYRFSDVALLLFGAEMASRNYAVELEKGTEKRLVGPYGMVNTEGQLNLSFQHQLSQWLWIECKTGYVRYLHSKADGRKWVSDIAFQVDKRDSGFFKLGIFLSPPPSYFCKQ